ncbi:MAG: gluconate 2-dehydrogenase subunit 3 family protein, partial [Bacteroidota bacterium]
MKRREALKLGGAALVSSSLFPLIQACKNESRLNWQPSFLSEEHAQLISALVDTILPRTDTPGGLDVKVDLFIDKVFSQLYDEAGQQAV